MQIVLDPGLAHEAIFDDMNEHVYNWQTYHYLCRGSYASRPFHHMPGIIARLFAIASVPNFFWYHSLVEAAVTAKFVATKTKAANMVMLIHSPFGAEMIARER